MVKDDSDSKNGNPLPLLHGLLFSRFSYIHHPTDWIAHTIAFVIPVMEHWLKLEIAQWVHPLHHEQTLLPWSYMLFHLNGYKQSNKDKQQQYSIIKHI